MAACWGIAAHSAYDMFSWYKYLSDILVFFPTHLYGVGISFCLPHFLIITYLQRTAEQSHSKPRRWKSMLIHQGCINALYSQPLLDSQSFEFLICILQVLNMPLICCTNVFFQGMLSRHITSPSEKTRPSLGIGTIYMGKATPVW